MAASASEEKDLCQKEVQMVAMVEMEEILYLNAPPFKYIDRFSI